MPYSTIAWALRRLLSHEFCDGARIMVRLRRETNDLAAQNEATTDYLLYTQGRIGSAEPRCSAWPAVKDRLPDVPV